MAEQRFLFIDDQIGLHEGWMGLLMIDYGATVRCATNNADALERAKDGGYEAIFYDVGMENSKTGHDFPVASKLRDIAGDSTRLIAISLCASQSGYYDVEDHFDGVIDTFGLAKEKIEQMKKLGIKLEKKVKEE